MGGGFRAEAAQIEYIKADGTKDTVEAIAIDANTTTLQAGNWYYVNSDIGTAGTTDFKLTGDGGDIHLILGDGKTLSGKTIEPVQGNTKLLNIYIYAQSTGDNQGKITLSDTDDTGAYINSSGNITINGGNIEVTSSKSLAYIGGAYSGNVTITGGRVTVNGQDSGNSKSGIFHGSDKLITLGYKNADDFILSTGYYNPNGNSTNPKIAEGKIFVNDSDRSKTYKDTPTESLNNVKLIPLTFTVKFDPNNGTGTMSDQKFVYGIAKTLTANAFTKDGAAFNGWNTQADGTGTSYTDGADGSKIFETHGEVITLYAQWNLNTYKITYELNGGTNDSANPASYTAEDAITLKAPTKNGYTFAGWTLDGKTITEIKGLTGDITLTAAWTPITYSIKYNLDGGNAANPTTYTIETASFTLSNPTKDGYTFTGWTGTDLTAETQTVEIKKGSMGNREYKANYSENQQGQQEQEQEQDSKEYEERVNTTPDNLANMTTEQKAAIKYLALTDTADTKITDLSQIDFTDFTNLNTLNLSGLKNLEQADLSQLPDNVKEVSLQKTNITSLTLKGSKVERVNAKGCTNLTNIDAEDNTSLTDLDVSDTSITSLNVKNCARLQSLNCSSCDLEAGYLNLEGCINLVSLDISKNHFGWFDYSESDLDSFECYSQDIQGWESKTTFNFTKFFNSGDVTAAGVKIMASAYTANVVGITGCNESGDKILTEYDSETGIAAFESAPAVIKYFYNTSFKNSSMDVTIRASGYQEEADHHLGDSGGCNSGLSVSSLIFAAFAFMFNKRH